MTRPGPRADPRHHFTLTRVPWPSSAAHATSRPSQTPPPRGQAPSPGQVRGPHGTGFDRWPSPSQPLKGEQVGGRCLLLPFGLLRALWLLLFFSLSVLGPGGSQDPRCFCLRAGPLLFIGRESTSGRCWGSSCLTLERERQWRNNGREHRQGAVKPPAAACPEPVTLGGQGHHVGLGESLPRTGDSS